MLFERALNNKTKVRRRIAYNNLFSRRLFNNIPIEYFFLAAFFSMYFSSVGEKLTPTMAFILSIAVSKLTLLISPCAKESLFAFLISSSDPLQPGWWVLYVLAILLLLLIGHL
jgi:hypothetical protein